MFVTSLLKMAFEEELGHESQQSGEASTPEQEEQMPLQEVTGASNDPEIIDDNGIEEHSEKEPLDKPSLFETEVKIKDGSVETELEKVSIENLESPEDSKNKTFDRKCGVIAVLLLTMIVGGAIAAIFITKFSGKISYTFKFAAYFGDHMVLQRAPDKATIWGYGPVLNGNSTVHLVLQNEDETIKHEYETVTQKFVSGGIWKFVLDPVSHMGPFAVKVYIEKPELKTIYLKDVLFGDVWICAGQENMQNSVNKLEDGEEELESLEEFSSIRIMSLMPDKANGPRSDIRELQLSWSKPTKESLLGHDNPEGQISSHFSALCWLYGKELQKTLLYPIGLVSATYSSSSIEDWVSPMVIEKCKIDVAYLTSMVYNALIHPLLSTSMYGVIWYHGELDALEQSSAYSCTVKHLIEEWRKKWYQVSGGATDPDFPFGLVQLAPNRPDEKITYGYTDIRWQQTANYGYVPNPSMKKTFMAVAVDLPFNSTYTSIPLSHTKEIAGRLVRGALVEGYQRKGNLFQGPFPTSYSAFKSNQSLVLYIDATEIDLRSDHGFEVCCANTSNMTCPSSFITTRYAPGREWVSTPIVNHGGNFVTLSWKDNEVCTDKYVVALRYLWRETPCKLLKCPVYDGSSKLPMPPYIRHKIKDDGKLHQLLKTPTNIATLI